MTNPQLFLASNSPRRRELLAQIGVRYGVVPTGLDEDRLPGEAAQDYVLRIALDKARAGRKLLPHRHAAPPVLGADTAVVLDGRILGKPTDARDAARMMEMLSERTHLVMSGVALVGSAVRQTLCVSEVVFRKITPAETLAYWETGEPIDKAGGYAIQGMGALFVERLRGSYSGVMGLPLFETAQLLAAEGIQILTVAEDRVSR